MKLITVSTLLNSADANLTASRLDAAGFHPCIKGELASAPWKVRSSRRVEFSSSARTEAAEALQFLNSPVTLDQPLRWLRLPAARGAAKNSCPAKSKTRRRHPQRKTRATNGSRRIYRMPSPCPLDQVSVHHSPVCQ